jgi:multidrug resistance efflux pump
MNSTSPFFYGFAENKETELSHDKPVLIEKIWAIPGQRVKKGQLLLEVQQDAIDFKIESVDYDIEQIEINDQQQKNNLLDQIDRLEAKRSSKIAAIKAEIETTETAILFQKNLLSDLKSFDEKDIVVANTPNQKKLEALKEKLVYEIAPIDLEIGQLKKTLSVISNAAQSQKQSLKSEKEFYQTEQSKLKILAPSDGIIGNILCKEGENISAFSTLVNFYESSPTIVKGYVHESLILQVEQQDTLKVNSSLHPSHFIYGEVIGLGSRIVEIPERLRKSPEIKTYGREVLISIPSGNPFLQKEKVMLNTVVGQEDKFLASLFSFL